MIARLAGLVVERDADRCILDVQGVGYLVQASTRTIAALPHPPERATLRIETQVREDSLQLFGFETASEHELFRLLTTLQGVGAKVALGILSAFSPNDLVAIVVSSDRASLTRAQGVGPRLADRILAELKGKLGALSASTASDGSGPAAIAATGIEADALLALSGLGFRRAEAHPVLMRVLIRLGPAGTLDQLIRDCLRELSPRP